jgi:hypothetical protein
MVLHHVPQRAVLVVIVPAVADLLGLGDGDLHVVDRVAVPQGLEQHVGEAQGGQILDRLLAQIVVDAEDLALVDHGGDGGVGDLGALQVATQRLFQDQACVGTGQAGGLQRLAGRAVETGRQREEDDQRAVRADAVGQLLGVGVAGDVGGHVVETIGEALPDPLLDRRAFAQLFAHQRLVAVRVMVRARHTDDPQIMRQQTIKLEEIQRRQQHPQGQVPRAAQQHQHFAPVIGVLVLLSQSRPPYDNVVMTCLRRKGKRPPTASPYGRSMAPTGGP